MFEGVKHLQDKFICQRKTKKVAAINILNVRLPEAILRCFNVNPRALFPDGCVQIHLAMML